MAIILTNLNRFQNFFTGFICFIVAMYVHHLGLYCVLFRRVLIYKIDAALQLTKLLLKKLLLLEDSLANFQ